MLSRRALLRAAVALGVCKTATAEAKALRRGSQTGLPLPRFVSLKAGVANLRRGPGLRYPVAWVYRRRYLPVMILREFGNWRLVRMPDGTHGWMHRVLLSGRRSFIVTAADATLRGAPSADARPRARLHHGVIGVLHHCDRSRWCVVTCHGYRGFVRQGDIWGTAADLRRAEH